MNRLDKCQHQTTTMEATCNDVQSATLYYYNVSFLPAEATQVEAHYSRKSSIGESFLADALHPNFFCCVHVRRSCGHNGASAARRLRHFGTVLMHCVAVCVQLSGQGRDEICHRPLLGFEESPP